MWQGHCRPAPFSCSRCVITLFRKQPGYVRGIKKSGEKKKISTSSEWMIHASTNQHYVLESNNQAIGLRVTLFGRKWLSIPARTANSCVRRYLLRWEREGSFETEICQVLWQEKATQVPHSLAQTALAFCGVIQVSRRLAVQFAPNWLRHYRTTVYGSELCSWIISLCVTPKSGLKNMGQLQLYPMYTIFKVASRTWGFAFREL